MDDNGRGRDLRDLLLIGLLVALPIIWLLALLPRTLGRDPAQQVALSTVAASVRSGAVESITVSDDSLTVQLHGGRELSSRKESGVSLAETLRHYGVTDEQLARVEMRVESGGWDFGGALIWLLPIGLLLLLVLLFARQTPVQGSTDQTLGFLKSRARKIIGDRPKVRFEDVAGADEAKEELQEIVQFLRAPHGSCRSARARRRACSGRSAGHRQNAAGPRGRRRGRRSVLQH